MNTVLPERTSLSSGTSSSHVVKKKVSALIKFVTELKKLSQECEFGGNSLIRDVIIGTLRQQT